MSATVIIPSESLEETAAVYGLLSRIWGSELDKRTLDSICNKPLSTEWKKAGGTLPASSDEQQIEALAVDYCQLLVGPKNHISPVQSVWDQSRFQGDATESMQKYIAMVDGFQPCVNFKDHVAVQLQLASTFFSMASQTRKSLLHGLATAFCQDHLEWTKQFFARVQEKAETDFYRSAAQVSTRFLFG